MSTIGASWLRKTSIRLTLWLLYAYFFLNIFQAEIYNDFIVKMRDDLQRNGGVISRVEFAGSRFKGTQIASSDYDNMFIKRDTSVVAQQSRYPGYSFLTKDGSPKKRQELLDSFRTNVQRSLRSIGAAKYAQIIQAYGPTVVVNYTEPGGPRFSIDMVFALEVSEEVGKEIYVGKAPQGSGDGNSNMWYRTVVLDEKEKMKTIDKGNECGKMAVRYLKKLKEIKPGLLPITSYSFEQALMYLKDEKQDSMFWRENNMNAILAAILTYMITALRRGSLPAYYDGSNNAIGKLTPIQREQLANRFEKLARKRNKSLKEPNFKFMCTGCDQLCQLSDTTRYLYVCLPHDVAAIIYYM